MNGGVRGHLESTLPPTSAPAWVSIASGKNPGKHGIYDFIAPTGHIITSKSVKGDRIWDILSRENLSCCIVNIPVTYPPLKINGCMISSFLTPPGKVFVHPPAFSELLESTGYRIGFEFERQKLDPLSGNERWEILADFYDILKKRAETAARLIELRDWDFFMVNFKEVDDVQHLFWDKKDTLLEFFTTLDGYLAGLCQNFKNALIISDHGFGPSPIYNFNVNSWLNKEGYLKLRGSAQKVVTGVYSMAYHLLPQGLQGFISRFLKREGLKYPPGTDSERTLAYRDRNGISITKSATRWEAIRAEIIEKLLNLTGEDGSRVIALARAREEAFFGPFVPEAPDIVILPHEKYFLSSYILKDIFSKARSGLAGSHNTAAALHGIFIANGPDTKIDAKIQGARVYDIAPTVLHILGLPVPDDMDGQVLREIFREESELARREVKYQKVTDEEGQVKNKAGN